MRYINLLVFIILTSLLAKGSVNGSNIRFYQYDSQLSIYSDLEISDNSASLSIDQFTDDFNNEFEDDDDDLSNGTFFLPSYDYQIFKKENPKFSFTQKLKSRAKIKLYLMHCCFKYHC